VQTAGFTPTGPFKSPSYANGKVTFTLDPTAVGVGTYGILFGATDALGNTSVPLNQVTTSTGRPAQAQCFYDIIYKVSGFVGLNPDAVGSYNSGQAVGLIWKVTDYNGVGQTQSSTFVEASSSPNKTVCDVAPEYAVLEEQFAGSSGLQNSGGGNYQFNWKTSKSYAGQCRTLVLRLAQPGLVGPLAKTVGGVPPAPSRRYSWINIKFT
jgi:hypothetical protein